MATFSSMSKMGGVCTEWVDGCASATTWIWNIPNSKIPNSNRIFSAEKCLFECFPMVPTRTFIIKYLNFKRNIFGWKVCFTWFPIIQTGTFMKVYRFQIFQFQTKYFRLKSVFSYVFLWFQPGLYKKKHKPNQWMFHIYPFIPFKY